LMSPAHSSVLFVRVTLFLAQLPQHGRYLVDSLWDVSEMLQDWECMTDLLVEESNGSKEGIYLFIFLEYKTFV